MTPLLVALTLSVPPASPYPALKTELDRLASGFQGRVGYCVTDLATGTGIERAGDERFPSASTIKTAIALHAIREVDAGRVKWTDTRRVPDKKDRIEYDASPWSYRFEDGVSPTLDGWVNLMIGYSDNLATRTLRMWFGTEEITATLEKLGFKDTKYLSGAKPESTRLRRLNGQFGLGMTTPCEMNRLLRLIAKRRVASAAGSERLLRILGRQYYDDGISVAVPPEVRVCSKSGAINRSRSDTAIVWARRPFVVTIYTDSQKDQRWTNDNEGDVLIVRMGEAIWRHLGDRLYTPPSGYDRYLPTGGGA